MKILLDTHVLLWTISNSALLSKKARDIIRDPDNDIFYSVVSTFEVQIKHLAHPDAMPINGETFSRYCKLSGFFQLALQEAHIFALGGLRRKEGAPSHKDPFDRLLISQAAQENMLFLTHDSMLSDYEAAFIIRV